MQVKNFINTEALCEATPMVEISTAAAMDLLRQGWSGAVYGETEGEEPFVLYSAPLPMGTKPSHRGPSTNAEWYELLVSGQTPATAR